MDKSQLKEMFDFVKNKNLYKADEPGKSLGKIVGYHMNDEIIPTLILDTEGEIAVSKIVEEKRYVIGEDSGDIQKNRSSQPVRENKGKQAPNVGESFIDDEEDSFTDTEPTRRIKITPLDTSIVVDDNGIPMLLPEIPNDVVQESKLTYNQRPLHKPAQTVQVVNVSPIVSLLEKAKSKPIIIKFELEINAYAESLIDVLLPNFEGAEKDIVDYIISKIEDTTIKNKIEEQLRIHYKFA